MNIWLKVLIIGLFHTLLKRNKDLLHFALSFSDLRFEYSILVHFNLIIWPDKSRINHLLLIQKIFNLALTLFPLIIPRM
jgi:hypothetical protein